MPRAPGQRTVTIVLSDASCLAPEVPSIAEAAPRVSGHGKFRHAGREVGSRRIQGAAGTFGSVNRLSL